MALHDCLKGAVLCAFRRLHFFGLVSGSRQLVIAHWIWALTHSSYRFLLWSGASYPSAATTERLHQFAQTDHPCTLCWSGWANSPSVFECTNAAYRNAISE